MNTAFTAPQGDGNQKTKLPVQPLPNGTYPGILTSIVDVGTQNDEYQGTPKRRRVLKMTWEIPTELIQVYQEDTELKPRQYTKDFTYMMFKNKTTGKKTNLLEFVEGIVGILSEDQIRSFDFTTLLNQYYNLNMIQYVKKSGEIGSKINSVGVFQNFWPDRDLTRKSELHLYRVDYGFDNLQFANLPFWMRNTIKLSEEAIAYAQSGGRFATLDENGNLVLEQMQVPNTGAANMPKVRMKNPQHIYADFIKQGWTDDLLVQQGYADLIPQAPVAAPAPVATAPMAPKIPQAPGIATPAPMASAIPTPTPAVPSAPVEKIVGSGIIMIDPNANYEAFIQSGWTDELLVQHGHAKKAVVHTPAPVVPNVPNVPVVPSAPVVPQAPATHAGNVNEAIQAFSNPVPMISVAPLPAPPVSSTPSLNSVIPTPVPAPAPTAFMGGAESFNEDEHDDLPF